MNTMQQEFDAVVAHLYKQGRPSKDRCRCVYRNSAGLSCAVGCRIPDEMYDKQMDNMPSSVLREIIRHFPNAIPKEITEYQCMFFKLQYAHDSCPCTDDGEFDFPSLAYKLGDIANAFNLTFTAPQQGE